MVSCVFLFPLFADFLHRIQIRHGEFLTCSFCGNPLEVIYEFGEVALAGAFLTQGQEEQKYPLTLCQCNECKAVQIKEKIPPEILFKHYFYRTSAIGTMQKHFSSLAKKIKTFIPETIVEIGCNDGVLLKKLAGTCRVIGIDPSDVVEEIEGVTIYNDFLSDAIVKKIGKADVVVACNVFAHIADINAATKAVYDLLTEDGVFIIEVNYLGDLIDKLQYDWIYHEHLYYYSLTSLENHLKRHKLSVFHVERLETHAGSIRFYISKGHRPSKAVEEMRGQENFDLKAFAKRIKQHCRELNSFLDALIVKGKKIAGYGACGRSNMMIQVCGLHQLSYMIDDAPAKQGFYSAGRYQIYSRKQLEIDPPDYILVFAWSFLPEIQERLKDYSGSLIQPLPTIMEL